MTLDTVSLILSIQSHFKMNLARAKCCAMMIIALIECRSVNLTRMSTMARGSAEEQSKYRRMRRFIREMAFDPAEVARFIFSVLDIPPDFKMNLILDRTNWKLCRLEINLLYLAVSYKGVGFPILVTWLEDKNKGNSDHFDRIDIMETFIKTFGKERIDGVYADREFIGDIWINWLKEEKINYVIRLKENGQYIANSRGRIKLATDLFRGLKNGDKISIGERHIGRQRLYKSHISALRNEKGELVVLMHSQDILDACERYRDRWKIELLFRMMKSGGFDLESLNITDPDRLDVLLVIVSIATTLSAKAGLIQEEVKPTPIKKHGFKAKNTVRIGIDNIICILKNDKEAIGTKEILLKIINFLNHIFDRKYADYYAKNIGELKIVL